MIALLFVGCRDLECTEGFQEGPYIPLVSDGDEVVLTVYSTNNDSGVLRLVPDVDFRVPIDPYSDSLSLQFFNRWGNGDEMIIAYNLNVFECSNEYRMELKDVKVEGGEDASHFKFFATVNGSVLRDNYGDSVEITRNTTWVISPTNGILIK